MRSRTNVSIEATFIETLVRERILILDGAMGTMIQQYNLTEEDFRGKRFAQIPGPVSYTHLDVYKRQTFSSPV